MYLCRQITMEVLLNLKKNVANVLIQRHSMKLLATAGCLLCGLRVYSLATIIPSGCAAAACFLYLIIRSLRAEEQPKNAKLMRKYVFLVLLVFAAISANAQQVTAPEPEFINSYCILTSDATYDQLPKESGTVGEHKNKAKKWGKLLGGAAQLAGAGGMLGIATAGSVDGVVNGVRVIGAAASVGSAADVVSGLAGSSGMDIIFKGKHSPYTVKTTGQDVRLIVKAENNEHDPMELYRIVRFNTSKKERRIQWMEFESSLIGADDTEKAGYINFSGHKYGEKSYLLTIPAKELEKGEYGIVYMSIATATSVPIGTFSVK